jgi:hypothetical protein
MPDEIPADVAADLPGGYRGAYLVFSSPDHRDAFARAAGLNLDGKIADVTDPGDNSAWTRDDAEQQKARLAMGGWTAKVSEREQAGRTVWRVRIGPYPTRAEADAQQQKLVDQGIEAQIVRVEKT